MRVLIYLCLAIVPFVHSIMLHQLMTPDEVMGIFHKTYDAVPYYEVVRVQYSMNTINGGAATKICLNGECVLEGTEIKDEKNYASKMK